MRMLIISASAGALILGACTSSGTAERSTLVGAGAGAAVGAAAGQVIAGRPGAGAAIGAGAGAIGGAAVGCSRAGDCFGRARDEGERRYDSRAGRYYYNDPHTGDTYWENGQLRARG